MMNQIQNKWFGDQCDSQSSDKRLSSSRLSLSSFWGLFLIAGGSSILALLVYFLNFLYKEQHNLRRTQDDGFCNKIIALLKTYDKRDLTSHTFKKSNLRQADNKIHVMDCGSVGASPSSNYPPSPSDYSVRDGSFEFYCESGDSSPRINRDVEMKVVPRNQEVALVNGEQIIEIHVNNN